MAAGAAAVSSELRLAPEDRRCRPGGLDNVLRRALAPASREIDLLGVRAGETVADLGTGVGYFVPSLLERLGGAGRLYAVDPDPSNLARVRSRPHPPGDLQVIQASAAHVPEIPSSSVDRALLSLVLCCLVDKSGTLGEAFRVLRPGGRALVTLPRSLGLRRGVRRALRVTTARWDALARERPWTILPVPSGPFVVRHLLEKPAGALGRARVESGGTTGPPPYPGRRTRS
jgi:SAM-dependent methyltransferase